VHEAVTVSVKERLVSNVCAATILPVIVIVYVPACALVFVYHVTTLAFGLKVMNAMFKL
jgi:hypothetical protein